MPGRWRAILRHVVGKLTWWAFGPVALLLCGWISWGRMFFGAAGWGVIFYPVIVVPAVVILAGPIAIAVVCTSPQASESWVGGSGSRDPALDRVRESGATPF